MYTNVEKAEVITEKQPSPGQVITDQKQPENMEYFNHLGSMITNDVRCKREINPGLPWQKQHTTRGHFNTSKLDFKLRAKLVKCHIWSTALCGAETVGLPKVEQNYVGSFEMWCWRRMDKISWTDGVSNEEALRTI
jgi:hypothetical protein